MRPKKRHELDVIDSLLDKAWEDAPAHLQDQLSAIPAQISIGQNRRLDRFAFMLNGILLLWGMGMMIYFWTPIETMIISFTQTLLGVSTLSPEILAQPIVGLIAMVFLLAGGVWLDMEKHPGAM